MNQLVENALFSNVEESLKIAIPELDADDFPNLIISSLSIGRLFMKIRSVLFTSSC